VRWYSPWRIKKAVSDRKRTLKGAILILALMNKVGNEMPSIISESNRFKYEPKSNNRPKISFEYIKLSGFRLLSNRILAPLSRESPRLVKVVPQAPETKFIWHSSSTRTLEGL
jgi:hypothetical protein